MTAKGDHSQIEQEAARSRKDLESGGRSATLMARTEADPTPAPGSWRLNRGERVGVLLVLVAVLLFGSSQEYRTALRTQPMTDLGVFACAAWAVETGGNLYAVTDWHGWHYHYPPALAILLRPLAHPPPEPAPVLAPGELRTRANTPWGYMLDGPDQFAPLGPHNRRFFVIVAVWYVFSVTLAGLSAHLLACALEGRPWTAAPPLDPLARRQWWQRRLLPLLACLGSLGTVLARGQVDVLMLAAVATALYLAARGRALAAGMFLTLPAAIKLVPAWLLLYPMWCRSWRMAAGVVMGLLLTLVAIPVVAMGPARTVEVYRQWVDVLARPALGQGSDTSRARELTDMNATDNQSVLVALHNWNYPGVSRQERPPKATPGERQAAYAMATLALLAVGFVAGARRPERPREQLLLAGLLIGLAFLCNPIVHHFYYLLMLPLWSALVDRLLEEDGGGATGRAIYAAVAGSALLEIVARIPPFQDHLRDWGVPLMGLLCLMFLGAMVLRQEQARAHADSARGHEVDSSGGSPALARRDAVPPMTEQA